MAIFNSYVKLPEGSSSWLKTPCFGWRISASLEDLEPEKLGVYKTLAEIGSKIS